jgi:hypothetical protein
MEDGMAKRGIVSSLMACSASQFGFVMRGQLFQIR